MSRLTLIGGALLIGVGCSTVRAQAAQQEVVTPSPGEQAILVVVAERLAANIETNETLAEDPVIVVAQELAEFDPQRSRVWSQTALAPAAAKLRARILPAGDVRKCGEVRLRPWYCTLDGADVLIFLGDPIVDGDTATITVEFVKRSPEFEDPNEALSSVSVTELVKADGQWSINRSRSVIAH